MDEVELVGEVDKYGLELARFVLEAEKQGFSPDQAVKYVSDWAAALPPEQITKDTSLYEYL